MGHATALACICIASVALLMVGCSGPGVSVGAVRGDELRATAEGHLSALLQVKTWQAILYWKSATLSAKVGLAGLGRVASLQLDDDIHVEPLPDGSMRLWGTLSNGNTVDYILEVDGSGHGTETRPGGEVSAISWTAPTPDGDLWLQHATERLFGGQRLDYDSVVDFATNYQRLDGQAETAGGRRMHFRLDRVLDGDDILALDMADGSRLELTVPLRSVEGSAYWPVFAEGARGVYTDAAGRREAIRLTGAGDRWDRCTSEAGGTVGQFALDAGLGGNGQLTRDGRIIAALRWGGTGTGTLDQLDVGSVDVIAGAASRDFQVDQWVAGSARLIGLPF